MRPGHLDLQIAAMRPTAVAAQAVEQKAQKVALDSGVRRGHTGHGDRLKSVELVLELLPAFPVEERLEAHGLLQRHTRLSNSAAIRAHAPRYTTGSGWC